MLLKFVCNFENGEVKIQLLDMDASGGTHQDAADAIHCSLKRVGGLLYFKISGQCTDSGGGGTLEGLAKRLQELKITLVEYLVANCCIHTLQLQLSSPTKAIYGDGGRDKKNVMQLCHSTSDLLNSNENWGLMKLFMTDAAKWVNDNLDQDIDETTGSDGDKDFAKAWNKIRKWRKWEKYDLSSDDGDKVAWKQCAKCILT